MILRFPTDPNDMLLSGGLVGQEALTGRAVVVDSPLGKGHVVMFASRPFWRYQTHRHLQSRVQRDPELEPPGGGRVARQALGSRLKAYGSWLWRRHACWP